VDPDPHQNVTDPGSPTLGHTHYTSEIAKSNYNCLDGKLSEFLKYLANEKCFSQTGRVIQTSQEARSVDCGDLTNQRGEMVCSPLGQPTSSCYVTAGSRLAELEQENQDLQIWVREGKCGSGWSSWGSWSSCDPHAGSCPTNQVHCKETTYTEN
jgi:hypothetical protein